MPAPADTLPRELVVCIFIHGFVLPIPRWIRAQMRARVGANPNLNVISDSPYPDSASTSTATSNLNVSPLPIAAAAAAHDRFKGTDGTFCGFPDRLKHVLTETLVNTTVECVVFPAYETKGELAEATARFVDWLTTLTVNLEMQHGRGSASAQLVLCGHSMGGLVAADALLNIASGRPKRDGKGREPIWPRIVACIAFDTPYLGLHPVVFKHSVSQVQTYVDAARSVASILGFGGDTSSTSTSAPTPRNPSRGLPKPPTPSPSPSPALSTFGRLASLSPTVYAAAAGTLLAGAAAGTAYYRKQDIVGGWQWASDHLRYVGNLWDEDGMKKRLEGVLAQGVVFRNFYTFLPASPPTNPDPRTFSVLPPQKATYTPFWRPTKNTIARDPIEAHVGMFEAKTNDGYYEMGLETVKAIVEAVGRDNEGRREREREDGGGVQELGRGVQEVQLGEKEKEKERAPEAEVAKEALPADEQAKLQAPLIPTQTDKLAARTAAIDRLSAASVPLPPSAIQLSFSASSSSTASPLTPTAEPPSATSAASTQPPSSASSYSTTTTTSSSTSPTSSKPLITASLSPTPWGTSPTSPSSNSSTGQELPINLDAWASQPPLTPIPITPPRPEGAVTPLPVVENPWSGRLRRGKKGNH